MCGAQINLKGLDGVQGPVYVGTGCCFKRRAIYGYDPPPKDPKASSGRSQSVFPSWLCGPLKKGLQNARAGKGGKKRPPLRTESSIPILDVEDIEEGIEGTACSVIGLMMVQVSLLCGLSEQ